MDIPITVKMRLGWTRDTENCVELAGLSKRQGQQPLLSMDAQGKISIQERRTGRSCRSVKAVKIPVIGNGDVVDGPSAKALLEETGCAAVAIGRAAWGNPWVFKEVNAYLEMAISSIRVLGGTPCHGKGASSRPCH